MIRFEHINMLYALLVTPVLLVLFMLMIRWKKRALKIFGDTGLISRDRKSVV